MPKLSTQTRADIFVHVGIILASGLIIFFAFFFVYLPWSTNHGEAIEVPNLNGMSSVEAIEKLENMGLDYEVSDSTYLPDKAPLSVHAQYPKEGSIVKSGRKIYLTIITENAPFATMPDVLGRSSSSATNQLQMAGFIVSALKMIPAIEKNTVLKVELDGREIRLGERIPKGTKLTLIVGDGLGNQLLETPSLVGMSLEEAKLVLEGSSLRIGSVLNDAGGSTTEGTVVQQRPEIGTKIKAGDVVDIWVSDSPTTPSNLP
ncbi:MAG: PASTA domain-containing protein [Spirosomataceae bacterium]